jgi:hypothetical protein
MILPVTTEGDTTGMTGMINLKISKGSLAELAAFPS